MRPVAPFDQNASLHLFPHSVVPRSVPPRSPLFRRPIVNSVSHPRIGLHLPIRANNPFLAQLAMNHGSGIIITKGIVTEDHDADALYDSATHLIHENPEEAGRLFTEVRDRMRDVDARQAGEQNRLYLESTFGSAMWGKVTEQTFNDLRSVRKKAKKIGDAHVMAREMLIRSVAHSRISDDETAIGVLSRLLNNEDMLTDNYLYAYAVVQQINMLANRAIRHTGVARSNALTRLYEVMVNDVKDLVNGLKKNAEVDEGMMVSLSKLYIFAAEFLLEQHRPLDAKEIVNEARVLFPDYEAVENVFNGEPIPEDGPSSHEVSPLHQLMMREDSRSAFSHLKAGLIEFLHQAYFPNNKSAWKTALIGAMMGAAVMSGGEVLAGQEATLADAMIGSSIGATAAVAVGKASYGLRATETRQAFITGYSEGTLSKKAFEQFMRLLGMYVVFGGALPFANAMLPEAIMASGNGQIHGLGSALSYVVSSGANRMDELTTAVATQGFVDGATTFWQNWIDSSYFAEAINNGLTLPFDDPIGKIFSGTGWNNLPEELRTFSYDDPLNAIRSVGLSLLYGYMGVSGLYAFGRMNPWLKRHIDNNLPPNTQWAMLPGAFLATSAAMMASGVEWYSAPPLVLWAYLIEHRHWVQGGGTYNVFRHGVWKDMPINKYMTAGAVQLLYIGPGAAIKPDLPDNLPLMQELWYNVQIHCGIVGYLAALGVFHAIFTGLSPIQTLKAKYAKAWTYEIPANVVKLMFGWTSFLGNFLGPLIKEFGFGAPVTNVFREAGGSPLQRDMFTTIIGKHYKNPEESAEPSSSLPFDGSLLELHHKMVQKAYKIHDDGVDAALKGEAYEFLRVALFNKPLEEQLIKLTDAYFMEPDSRVILGSQFRWDWYGKIIYRALTDPNTSPEIVENYLKRLRVIASDVAPHRKSVRVGFILATLRAMASKAHGARIEEFFTEGLGKGILDAYDLTTDSDDPEFIKENTLLKEDTFKEAAKIGRREGEYAWRFRLPWGPRAWINRRLKRLRESPVDSFYSAAAVAGRRYLFSAPFAGRSLVENGATFSSFLLAAAQGDPAFQTTADPTLFAGTVYGLLMTPAREAHMTTQNYTSKVITPLLDIVEQNAKKVGDNRRDVRHNLLVSVWLASQGPHGEVIRNWMEQNKHLYQANGIYGMLKHDEHHGRLPRILSQRRVIRRMFREFLWNSDNSTDGIVVYPLSSSTSTI